MVPAFIFNMYYESAKIHRKMKYDAKFIVNLFLVKKQALLYDTCSIFMALIKLSVLENFYVKYWKKVFQKIISVFRKICLSLPHHYTKQWNLQRHFLTRKPLRLL